MNSEELRQRTKRFALSVMGITRGLPRCTESQILGRQLFRSATSVAANYRAAGRARSRAEFISKLSIVVEEIDESLFWLELIEDSKLTSGLDFDNVKGEATELVRIFAASRKTAKQNLNKSPNRQIAKSLNH